MYFFFLIPFIIFFEKNFFVFFPSVPLHNLSPSKNQTPNPNLNQTPNPYLEQSNQTHKPNNQTKLQQRKP